jgi:hypothetical protein
MLLAWTSLDDMLLAGVPPLDLVEAAPVGLVGVVGLAVAELGELAGELLGVLERHRVAEASRLLHSGSGFGP